jgi:DNA polymerase-3 subunit delta
MDALALLETLHTGEIAPCYVLHGGERFLINQILTKLKKRLLSGPFAELNYNRIKAEGLSGEELSTQIRQMPMMAPKRLLVLENADKLSPSALETLDKHLAQPEPQTCVVVIADKFDLRTKVMASANRRKQVHKAEALKDSAIIPFLRQRAAEKKFSLTPDALSALANAVGSDCAALDDAVERLGLFVGPGNTATDKDVFQAVAHVRERSIFELVDAMGHRQVKQAMLVVEDLLFHQQEPLAINAMLARHVRQLLQLRIHLHSKTPRQELAGILGVPEFVVGKLLTQTNRFKGKELERALARLAATDLELKSSRRTPRLVMEQTVLDLCLG